MSSTTLISKTLATEVIKKIQNGSHGVILMNLPEYDYFALVNDITELQNTKPPFFFVGFTEEETMDIKNMLSPFNNNVEMFFSVEIAEQYRHKIDVLETRIVVVKRQIAKLSSLLWYEQITTPHLYKQLCLQAQEFYKETNDAINNLWAVLETKPIKEILSFEQLVNYFEELKINTNHITSKVINSMYLLGLLPDKNLLDNSKRDEIRKKLIYNNKIVQKIRFLDKSDLKILQSMKTDLDIQEKIFSFYKKRDNLILKELTLQEVESVLSSINKTKQGKEKKEILNINDNEALIDTTTKKNNSKTSDPTGVSLILDNDKDTIDELITHIDEEFEKWEKGKKAKLAVETNDGISTKVEFIPEVHSLVNTFISNDTFGGIIETSETNTQDALVQISKSKVNLFDSNYIKEILIKLKALKAKYPQEAEEIISALNQHIILRKQLIPYVSRLADSPMLKVADKSSDEELYNKYLENYSILIRSLKDHYAKFALYSAAGTKEIIARINSLDTIFIKSPDSIHAVLSPLNPLYLWKYVELGQRIKSEMQDLEEMDKAFLVRAADDIPNPLSTIFVSSFISNERDEVIVEVSKIGNLPIYSSENFINQSIDGLEVIKNSIKKFISVYKHSKIGLKIGLINPPDLDNILKMFNDLIPSEIQGLQIDIFKTKETSYSWSNLENIDEDLVKLFSDSNRYVLKIHNEILSFSKLEAKFKKNPYHLLVLFDPSNRSITEIKSESRANLKIHPLCIPKVFYFDPVTEKLSIIPATSGNIFSNHHDLVARLNDRPKGWHNTVESNLEPLKENLEAFIDNSEWLIIADANLKNLEVSTIGSEKCIFYSGSQNREIGIYSSKWSKLIRGLDKVVRKIGNYIPEEKCLESLLTQMQLLNEKSVLNLINVSVNTTFDSNKSKGTIGSAIASSWYKDTFTNSILASLDTDLARNWLKNRDNNTLSDLIGIRKISDTEAIVDIIEVKTHDGDFKIASEENVDGTKEITGHAVDQVTIINKLIKEILFDQSKITSVSRRELWRFQVFKILHSSKLTNNEKESWTNFLNDLFSNNLERIKINNIISYVNFNSNDLSDLNGTSYSSELPITLYQLNNDIITGYISNCGSVKKLLGSSETVDKKRETELVANHPQITDSLDYSIDNNNEDTIFSEPLFIDEQDFLNIPYTYPIEKIKQEEFKEVINDALSEFISNKAKAIQQAMKDYNIDVQEVDSSKALVAARFIRFRIKLRPGEKLSKIDSVKSDIGREIEASSEIFVGNERGSNYVYLDVPRESSDTVPLLHYLKNIPQGVIGNLNVVLGQDPSGEMVYLDLAKAPHLLTAGSTGSGKTIFLYSLIVSLVSQYSAEELELVIIDPKQTDFIYFEELPHLRNSEVIIEPDAAISVLNDLIENELPKRTNLLRSSRNRDILTYNEKNKENPLKPILVIVDEYADLIAAADLEGNKAEFERNMVRLAQRSRNIGIHLVIATQRPSADIVTSRLKANVPTRISFSLPANQDSRTILDATGAEDLLGKGDMLYSYNGDIQRLQGLFISENDLEEFVLQKKYK